jgi:NADH-quinone oxidoreductase subunit N
MLMYMYEPKQEFSLVQSPALALALAISVTGVLVIGVYPSAVLDFAKASIVGIL